MRRLTLLIIGLVITAVALGLGTYYIQSRTGEGLRIFAAGSLAIPLKQLDKQFEEKYGAKVYLETSGSVQAVKKISELHMPGDIVAVADYNAIKNYLVPNYTSWYIKFARSELVIVYTEHSRYSDNISSENWFEILSRSDVRIGFSSPNDDPCGYRAVMMFYLSDLFYHKPVFENIVENNTGIWLQKDTVVVPDDSEILKESSRVYIKPKSVDLLADLESGQIDYAVEYLSVARQHNLKYISLPDDINLSNSSKSEFYRLAKIRLADGNIVHGDAINYAITIPKNAKHWHLAIKYIRMLLGDDGKKILENCGQKPIYEPWGNVPGVLRK